MNNWMEMMILVAQWIALRVLYEEVQDSIPDKANEIELFLIDSGLDVLVVPRVHSLLCSQSKGVS